MEGWLNEESNGTSSANGVDTGDEYEDLQSKIFVNRSVKLEKIKHYGFDMDYTLALYKWPAYSEALFMYALDAFVGMEYPKELGALKYDIGFPVRGLWFDTVYGTFVKVDSFGNILMCVLGYQQKNKREIDELYPGRFVNLTKRMYVFNTPFNIPEVMFFAAVINFFVEKDREKNRSDRYGVWIDDKKFKTFTELFTEMREAIEKVHEDGLFKKYISNHLSEYVEKDELMPLLLQTLKEAGKKVFLITNSDWGYTNDIMTYLFENPAVCDERYVGAKWHNVFDLVVTNSRKPTFFTTGTPLFEVDCESGTHTLLTGDNAIMKSGGVYSGGNVLQLEDALGIMERSVLYIGDHIYGDILKCKKNKGWKTFLVVKELDHQIACWVKCKPLIKDLETVRRWKKHVNEYRKEKYAQMERYDEECIVSPEINGMTRSGLSKSMKEKVHEIDQTYGKLGGLFVSGTRETFFASQVKRYADIYATTCTNLLLYPLDYHFMATRQRLPHELLCDEIPESATLRDEFDVITQQQNLMSPEQTATVLETLKNIIP